MIQTSKRKWKEILGKISYEDPDKKGGPKHAVETPRVKMYRKREWEGKWAARV
jgi:hypothetical protein